MRGTLRVQEPQAKTSDMHLQLLWDGYMCYCAAEQARKEKQWG